MKPGLSGTHDSAGSKWYSELGSLTAVPYNAMIIIIWLFFVSSTNGCLALLHWLISIYLSEDQRKDLVNSRTFPSKVIFASCGVTARSRVLYMAVCNDICDALYSPFLKAVDVLYVALALISEIKESVLEP